MKLVAFAANLRLKDSTDMWKALGNEEPQQLIDASEENFQKIAVRWNA